MRGALRGSGPLQGVSAHPPVSAGRGCWTTVGPETSQESPGGFWRFLEASGDSWELLDVVAICYHVLARMQPPGSSWRLLGLSGVELYIHCTHWALLEVSGNSWRGYWRLLEAAGASEGFWRLLEASGGAIGGSWRILETPGGSWRLLGASGGFWELLEGLLEAPGGCFRRLLEASGDFWRGYWRLLEAPGGSWRLLEAPRLEGLQTYSPNTSGA